MTDAVDLFSQQAANRSRSHWLVAGFVLFFAWLGFGGDLILYEVSRTEYGSEWTTPVFGLVFTGYALLTALWAWWYGSKAILAGTGAIKLDEPISDQERQLVNVVDEMSIASGLPRPTLYIIPEVDPNAFATGRDEFNASVAVTQGLLDLCSRDELQAVIGHELAHIKNHDARLMTLLAAMVGAISLMSDYGRRLLFSRSASGAAGAKLPKGKRGGPLLLLLLALWIVSWLLAPLISRLVALGVSRHREFLADAMSAQFTRNPLALAQALEKIERCHEPTSSIKRCAAHLCIVDPVGRRVNLRQGRIADLLGTHPPMQMRVSRLRAMAFRDRKRTRPTTGELAAVV
jgi:heat shock protein HtpX